MRYIWLFFFPYLAISQTASLTGFVRDGISGSAMAGTQIYIQDSLAGKTDSFGVFSLNALPTGRCVIRLFMPGYHIYEDNSLLLAPGITQQLDIELYPLSFLGDTAIVTPSEYLEEISSIQHIGVEETDRFPATFFDPARLVQTFAGAATINDQANHIAVRGTSPNALTWRIEGLEIVNPNHLSNAGTPSDEATLNGGGVNMISAQLLQSTNYYVGFAPARFSKGSSATIDMKIKNGNLQEWQSTAQIGLLGLDVASEGPIVKDKLAIIGNYRYSTIGLLSDLGIDVGDETIKFQDASLALNLKLKESNLKVFGMWGNSTNEFIGPEEDLTSVKDLFEINYKNNIGISGFTYQYRGRRMIWNSALIYSSLQANRDQDWIRHPMHPRYPRMSELNHSKISGNVEGVRGLGKGFLSIGLQYLQESIQTMEIDPIRERSISPYIVLKHRFGPRIDLNLGSRVVLSDIYQASFEPNISLQYELRSRGFWSIYSNLTSQVEHPLVLGSGDQRPKYLNSGMSYLYPLSKRSHLKSTVFYQRSWNHYPVGPNSIHPINWFSEQFISEGGISGHGLQQGVEIEYKKYFSAAFFGLANVTYLDSKYRLTAENSWENSRWDQPWIFNFSFGKEYEKDKKGKHRIFGFHVRFNGYAGLRELPIDRITSLVSFNTVYFAERGYIESVKPTFRTDLKIYWRRIKNKRSGLLSIDIQNALNTQNEAYHYYDTYLMDVATQTQLGIIPVISYKYYWHY